MKIILAADIGSTYTKLTAIDVSNCKVIATAKSFTTIHTDITEGFQKALDEIYSCAGKMEFDMKIASSSAAGGLKMISVGLVPNLTANAAKTAAANAGAKVLKSFSYELNTQEKEEIEALQPDIILLSGGIDGGNKEVILHNANVLASIKQDMWVIVAGNKAVSEKAFEILQNNGKKAIICENVMPEFNKLNIEPAKEAIRNLFIENIIHAKGLDKIQSFLSSPIIPTPLAVYEAMELFAKGYENEQGFTDLMAFDIGGATTDVYSCADGLPNKPNITMKGIKEPFTKRTVEADIGMRYSLSSLIDLIAINTLTSEWEQLLSNHSEEINIKDILQEYLEMCRLDPETIPRDNKYFQMIDELLATHAIRISANRHCGTYEKVYTPFGEAIMQNGKDLTGVKYVIGTGGVIIHSKKPADILKAGLYDMATPEILKPNNPKLLIDKENIITAMGLLSRVAPQVAFKIMKKNIIEG